MVNRPILKYSNDNVFRTNSRSFSFSRAHLSDRQTFFIIALDQEIVGAITFLHAVNAYKKFYKKVDRTPKMYLSFHETLVSLPISRQEYEEQEKKCKSENDGTETFVLCTSRPAHPTNVN